MKPRAELLLAPAASDPTTVKARATDVEALERVIAARTEALPARLPAVARADRLRPLTGGGFGWHSV